MKQYLKVKDHPNLVRDPVSKAIINLDTQSRTNYINQKAVKEEVAELRNEMAEIKAMLSQLINKA